MLHLRRQPAEAEGGGEEPAGIGVDQPGVPGFAHLYGLLLLCATQAFVADDTGHFGQPAADQDCRGKGREQKPGLTKPPA